MSTTLLCQVLGAVLLAGVEATAPGGTAGPLVGQVTNAFAELWMYVPKDTNATVHYRRAGTAGEGQELSFVVEATELFGSTEIFEISSA